MKKITRIALLSASLGASTYAAPFLAVGDGAELFLTGGLGIRADDNILFETTGEDSDLIFDITPGIDLTFGKNAQMQGSLALNVVFTSYSDNSNLNTELFNGDFVTKYDDGKLKMGFNLGYHELNQNSATVRGLTRRDVFNAGGNAEVEISQISSVGAGVTFVHENYKTDKAAGYTDSDMLTVPLDFYYKWTPKVDLSFGYRFRDTQVDIGEDTKDHFFNVGARGEFSPKFTGVFKVGFNNREFDSGGDDSTIGLDASFVYEVSPKTSLQFGAANDYGTSALGRQYESLSINGAINTKLSEEWAVNFGLAWRSLDFSSYSYFDTTAITPTNPSGLVVVKSYTDDFLEARLGTTYIVNTNVRLGAEYIYRDLSSDRAANEFSNNVFAVSANFRY